MDDRKLERLIENQINEASEGYFNAKKQENKYAKWKNQYEIRRDKFVEFKITVKVCKGCKEGVFCKEHGAKFVDLISK